MSKDFERLWCHKKFKVKIKTEAAKNGFSSVKEYTEWIANQDNNINNVMENKHGINNKKKWKFNI
jgi:hypothetical protein